jgi:hypothetical protein
VPASVFGQRLLALLLLLRLGLQRQRRDPLRLGLGDGGVLQFDLVGEIVQRGLRAGNAGLRLRHLGLVVGRIDLHQELAGLDALEVVGVNLEHGAGDAAAQPGGLGADVGVVGGLLRPAADPAIPAQRRQPDEGDRGCDRHQRQRQPAPGLLRRRQRRGRRNGVGLGHRWASSRRQSGNLSSMLYKKLQRRSLSGLAIRCPCLLFWPSSVRRSCKPCWVTPPAHRPLPVAGIVSKPRPWTPFFSTSTAR